MASKGTCPKGPLPKTEILLPGTVLTRFRQKASNPAKAYPANSFNPNIGKNWQVDKDGARFSPFPLADGTNVHSIYAANSYVAAALERIP